MFAHLITESKINRLSIVLCYDQAKKYFAEESIELSLHSMVIWFVDVLMFIWLTIFKFL